MRAQEAMQDQLGLRPQRDGVWRDCWKAPEGGQGASGSPSHFTLGALVCRCLGARAVPPVRCPLMGSWGPFRTRGAGQSCLGVAVSDPCCCPSGLGEDGEVSQDPPSCQAGMSGRQHVIWEPRVPSIGWASWHSTQDMAGKAARRWRGGEAAALTLCQGQAPPATPIQLLPVRVLLAASLC